jgi:signal transduction histidine kinase/ligand-binding sensor domain-containing protein
MDGVQATVRKFVALVSALLGSTSCAFGLNSSLDVSQYSHTAWRIGDGFCKGAIHSIAQTGDGYLWLGTEFGLLRFDGVKTPLPLEGGLPSNQIRSLLSARDGTLWVGTSKGLASWKGDKLTKYAALAGQPIFGLVEDQDGTVWAGGNSVPNGRLCAIQNGRAQCYGEDGSIGSGVSGMYEDSQGNLWVGVADGLWRWKPGQPKRYPLAGEPNGIKSLVEGEDGVLLIGAKGAIRRLVDNKLEVAYALPAAVSQFQIRSLLRDRDGGLWIGTSGRGLVHMHKGRTDVFNQPDGLSDDDVSDLFEDREGNIWVATVNGLDRFRDFAVATFSVNQGFSSARIVSVLAAKDGSIWLSTLDGLNKWNGGRVTIYRDRNNRSESAPKAADRQEIAHDLAGSGLPEQGLESLFQDDHGRVWVSTLRGTGYLENDRFISISGIPGGRVHAIVGGAEGDLWISHQDQGLFRLRRGKVVQHFLWSQLGHRDFAYTVAADPVVEGGLWVGFSRGGMVYFKDGQVRGSYGASDGLAEGRINDLHLDRNGTLWAATEGGLSRVKNGRAGTLTGQNGLPCDAVHWVREDDAHSFWLYMACGLVRVSQSELDAWAAGMDKRNDSKWRIKVTVFDSSDGVRSRANAGGFGPHVSKAPNGKLWFRTMDGVAVVDPNHLPFNSVAPPVHIEQIIADRRRHDTISNPSRSLRLPPLLRDLEIDYTALSLVAPEKILFRYKLEGKDHDWQDAGYRRQAFYNDLPPGNYRFRVRASNDRDVWNDAGTFLDFAIAPAYYQTRLFQAACLATFFALLVSLYRLRLRRLARQFRIRMEERVSERTRVARDLHDTLLQSFQGVLLNFHSVAYLLPARPAEAQQALENVIEQARQAITEGRNAVEGLRAHTAVTNDLAGAIGRLREELAADQPDRSFPDFSVNVEGAPRNLAPITGEEVYRIAGEVIRNAFRHAQARRIEVEIRYDRRQFRLRVRDDGKGIAPRVLSGGGCDGHYGLAGMHERAKLVGGKLVLWSELGSGTEAELTIPGSVAYAKSPTSRRPVVAEKEI